MDTSTPTTTTTATTFFVRLFTLFFAYSLFTIFGIVTRLIRSVLLGLLNLLRFIIPSSTSSLVQTKEMTPPLTTLPEDLIFNEILPRLPVKSLVRFQSVCKPWQSSLTGPNRRLVSMHLWRHRNKYVMIKHRRRYAPAVHAITLLSRERTILVDSLQIPFESHFRFMRVAGSCNGLVCVTDSEFSGAPELPIILWNPSLRKFRVLPRSILSSVLNTVELHERIGQIVHGFGYHPVLDDHRLVRILYLYGEFEVLRIRSEMYSLRTNSWKEVGEPFYHRFLDATCVASNGVLHWIVSSGSSLHFDFVLCFDLRREEFRRLELPHISLRSRLGTRLAESAEGRLCLTAYTPHESADDDKMVHVWDLNYEGFIWEKKLSVGPFPRIDRLLGCGLNGEIYLEDNRGRLALYDPSSDEIKKVKEVHADRYTFEVNMYVESLIWSDGALDQVVEDQN